MTNQLNTKFQTNSLPRVRGKYLFNEPLCKHTWFGVGGPAEIMFIPSDLEDLRFFIKNKPADLDLTILGGGSNFLVRDGGIRDVVIKLDSPFFRQIQIHEQTLTCFAGVKNANLKKILIDNGFGGLEFLCSIPGTIGGSVKTNAGCFGKQLQDVLVGALVMDQDANLKEIKPQDLNLSYRNSQFPKEWILIALTLQFQQAESKEIEELINTQKQYRLEHQPYGQKTAGSTFKNPAGLSAWKLIQQAGCANLKIGGAKVSEKHSNFLINTGTATARDIELLGEEIIRQVKEKTSVTLEWEIQKIGEEQ